MSDFSGPVLMSQNQAVSLVFWIDLFNPFHLASNRKAV